MKDMNEGDAPGVAMVSFETNDFAGLIKTVSDAVNKVDVKVGKPIVVGESWKKLVESCVIPYVECDNKFLNFRNNIAFAMKNVTIDKPFERIWIEVPKGSRMVQVSDLDPTGCFLKGFNS